MVLIYNNTQTKENKNWVILILHLACEETLEKVGSFSIWGERKKIAWIKKKQFIKK